MDDSQVTGATSSYARKYALNGLFAIDDTKDNDTDEARKEAEAKQSKPNSQSKTTSDNSAMLKQMYDEAGIQGFDKADVDIFIQKTYRADPVQLKEQNINSIRKRIRDNPDGFREWLNKNRGAA